MHVSPERHADLLKLLEEANFGACDGGLMMMRFDAVCSLIVIIAIVIFCKCFFCHHRQFFALYSVQARLRIRMKLKIIVTSNSKVSIRKDTISYAQARMCATAVQQQHYDYHTAIGASLGSGTACLEVLPIRIQCVPNVQPVLVRCRCTDQTFVLIQHGRNARRLATGLGAKFPSL